MATRIKRTAKDLYDEDFYVWGQNQAQLLRDKRFDELDLANLIEEIEDLGGALRRSTRLRIMIIIDTSSSCNIGREASAASLGAKPCAGSAPNS